MRVKHYSNLNRSNIAHVNSKHSQFLGSIYELLGSRYIKIRRPSKTDITAICSANGVTDALHISEIINSCDGDLRRAKKLIQNKSAAAKKTNTETEEAELLG